MMSETKIFFGGGGNQSLKWDWYWDCQNFNLDYKTGIKTFWISVLILRPVLRLSRLQSLYELYETVIKTLRFAVLKLRLVSRLSGLRHVSRLRPLLGLQTCNP